MHISELHSCYQQKVNSAILMTHTECYHFQPQVNKTFTTNKTDVT